ncbi:hypothetical protein BX616_008039 [Lobosporangium transversale]|uniref:Uncharacterized protein n=1 Tax=Lobosporangium transversale TaxID=64571 RepID=A0A1Y2GJF7_9FUNG|nr:hypothetical protein BCR41DRAFT_358905 [Lobosporangium transversale]KAF9914553.1 hypothetical protein BX616_008039 [Lobosporangium transversale]ORZ09121.1 hypothetical protein BCR41DRAFT_358905 [Lobosporangium transversale]|eukprot:XP_021878748.1 hypothetical protein BCR41DRAFT_358905 [Lobosporangium transversale]
MTPHHYYNGSSSSSSNNSNSSNNNNSLIINKPRYEKAVFCNNNSAESLLEYDHQQQQQQQAASIAELLRENLALTQKNVLAQQEVSQAQNNQARLENQVYELDQKLAESRKEIQRLQRAKKDNDRQLDQNNAAFEKERAMWAQREAELTRRLKFATRPLIVQAPAKEEESKDGKEPSDLLPPQIQQQITENTAAQARALRAQEKIVADLRQQIFVLNQELIERQHTSSLRESELQAQISQAHELNKSLMEENESFQLLLHEKSMNGEFMQTSIMKSTGYDDDHGTSLSTSNNGSLNLADELVKANELVKAERPYESLVAELETLKDEKTALVCYIAKILTRIMEKPGFTSVLAADYSSSQNTQAEPSATAIKDKDETMNSDGSNLSPGPSNEANNADGPQSQEKLTKQTIPNRPRSHSILQSFFPRSKPAAASGSVSGKGSDRSSSDDDSSSARSARLASFQEGHAIEDSPRASQSSADYPVEPPPAPEYEQLTTFQNPYTRQELRRQSSLHVTSRDRQRRQTIGAPNVSNSKGVGHGRYVSEYGRPAVPPLPPMPESIPSASKEKERETIKTPVLSISTSETSSISSLSTAVATPVTPVVPEGGIFRAFRRMSLFGASAPGGNVSITSITTQPIEDVQK